MKIINYKKFFKGMCLIIVLIVISFILIGNVSFSYTTKKYKTIYVCSGDTLWSIATNLQNTEYYKGKDVRDIISDVKLINNLKNSNLSIGDELIIPVV